MNQWPGHTLFKYTNNFTIFLYRDAYYFQIGGFDDGTWPFTKPKTYHTNLTKTNNFIQTATNRLRLRIKMKTFGICLILHQLASPVLAGQSPTAGFRWGDWSEWEPCVKVGKNHRRRRICFGPIVNKKIDKKNCEYNLGGSNIDVARCTDDDMVSNDGLSLGRMENPIKSSQWQAWQEWSKCQGNPPVKKRVRYCGISIRRQVQSNRICKTTSARTGGRAETNKEIIPCGNEDVQGGLSLGGRTTQSQFTQNNRIELSAPECYYPPGSPVEPGIGRIVGGKKFYRGVTD